jgi:hypothetical protein
MLMAKAVRHRQSCLILPIRASDTCLSSSSRTIEALMIFSLAALSLWFYAFGLLYTSISHTMSRHLPRKTADRDFGMMVQILYSKQIISR